jgi:hypothetical protein
MLAEDAIQAIKALDEAGACSFITCESGHGTRPQVTVKFKHIQDAQSFHRALIRCGEVARLIVADTQEKLEQQSVRDMAAAAGMDISDIRGEDIDSLTGKRSFNE